MRKGLGLFSSERRSQLWVLGVVAVFTLVAANMAWLFPTLDELETNAYFLERAVAVDAFNQLSSFFTSRERALLAGADLINQNPKIFNDIVSRLLKENPSIESLSVIDVSGKEIFKNHRFLLTTKSDLRNKSDEELFRTIQRKEIYRSSVVVSGVSEPIITIAVPLDSSTGFSGIVAEINLKFLLDVVRNTKIGEEGISYVVDKDGYIIAHPNSSLVFGRTNALDRKLIARALAGEEVDTRNEEFSYRNEKGEDVFAMALPFELTEWAIIVENSKSTVFAPSQRILNVAIISFGLEILLIILLIWNYFSLVSTAQLFYDERNQREAILNNLGDGVLEYNENSMIVLMNPKAEELLGVKFNEITGIKITPEFTKIQPRAQALVELLYPALAPFTSSAKEMHGTRSKIMELHTSKPELKLSVTITQVMDQTGATRGFLKIIHDISREQLISRIKSEFVSIAAHQLRTPLSALKWTLKLILEGDVGPLTKEQRDFLEKGYITNERMIKLVNDLLNAARIEEGRFGYDLKDFDLESLLKTIISNYSTNALSKSINLTFENKTKNLPQIFADPEKITLVVTNLLDNAFKYTPKNGNISLVLDKQNNFAVVSIKDNGVGIPETEKKRVFTKFFRASNVLKMDTEGTGLGLFIVRNILKRHGGNITFSSKLGEGTTFSLTLPLNKEYVPKTESPQLEEFLETI
ncbi:Cache 3/Cache 2 fusion domain-containing protein [Candidatus Giovannonibacteria bacterium]|nr:Cache 3/Cache 2 fusion domain-containing protein [Candidatus Giovannonibacteria bacterium]